VNKRASDQGRDVSEEEVELISYPDRGALLRRRIVQDGVKNAEGMLEETAPYLESMNTTQKISMESAGTALRNVNTALEDPSAADLPGVVQTQGANLSDIVSNIQKVVQSENALFSTATRDSLQTSSQVATDIGQSFDKIGEQEGDSDEPFTFDGDA
jgi:hypothetical protein